MIEAYFIRHGESQSNAGMLTEHPGSAPITERGHAQAQILSQMLDCAPGLIVTSSYIRTKQTAAPTIAALKRVVCVISQSVS